MNELNQQIIVQYGHPTKAWLTVNDFLFQNQNEYTATTESGVSLVFFVIPAEDCQRGPLFGGQDPCVGTVKLVQILQHENQVTCTIASHETVYIAYVPQTCEIMVIKDTELFTQDNAVMRAIYTAYRQPRVLLATNVRDEDNILEWVSYHQKLGFDRVLILDHQSKVSVQRLLESHNLMKNVIVMPQPIQNHYLMKRDFLNVAVTYAKSHHFTWMLYIDGDEYLYLKNEIPDVQTFLTRFPPEASVIAVNWLIFGSNGKHDADCAALIPTFLKSDAKFDPHVKSFVRPEKSIGECNCGHSYTIANEKKCVFDVRGKLLGRSDSSFPTSLPIEDAPAFIAHYQMQSYSRYLRNRIHLPRDDTGEFRAQMSEIDFHALHNDRDNMLMLKRQKKHQSPDLLHS